MSIQRPLLFSQKESEQYTAQVQTLDCQFKLCFNELCSQMLISVLGQILYRPTPGRGLVVEEPRTRVDHCWGLPT
jgi:hypothetical protein